MFGKLATVAFAMLLMTASFAQPISAGAVGSDPASPGAGDIGQQASEQPTATGADTDAARLAGHTVHSRYTTGTPINATIALRRIQHKAGRIEVTATYKDYPSSGFDIQLPKNKNVAVSSTNGFRKRTGNTYAWDGSTTNPSITYRLNPNMSAGPRDTAVDVGKWALVRGSYVSPRPTNPVRNDWWDGLTYSPQNSGVVVGNIVYLGRYTERTRTARNQKFRVVVTEPANGVPMTSAQTNGLDNSVTELEDIMANVSDDFEVGERDPTVTVLIGPKQVSRAEAEDTGYLLPMKIYRGKPAFVTETAIHEYVHTRQNFTERTVGSNGQAGTQTAWLTEGQAQYYEYLYSCREGEISSAEFRQKLQSGQITGAALADKSTWSTHGSTSVKYEKGALVLAALDNKIARQTGGQKTLEDVFRRLNGHDGEINQTVFADTVATVAGTRMDGFMQTYVTGTDAPNVPPRTACVPRVIHWIELFEGLEIEGESCPDYKLVCDQLPAAGLTDNERALIHLRTDTGEPRYYVAKVADGQITAARKVDDPSTVNQTVNVRTDEATVEEIYEAEDQPAALGKAVRSDEITFDGVGTGPGNRARIAGAKVAVGAYEVATGIASTITDTIGGLFG